MPTSESQNREILTDSNHFIYAWSQLGNPIIAQALSIPAELQAGGTAQQGGVDGDQLWFPSRDRAGGQLGDPRIEGKVHQQQFRGWRNAQLFNEAGGGRRTPLELGILDKKDLVAWIIPKDALSSCFSTPGIT